MKKILISVVLAITCLGTQAASFDCAKASTPIEKTICVDDQLSDLDSQLMQVYKKSLSNSTAADVLKAEQRAWLKDVRSKCQDAACLKQAYSDRITTLNSPTIQPPSKESPSQDQANALAANDAAKTEDVPQVRDTNELSKMAAPAAVAQSAEVKNDGGVNAAESNDVGPPSAGISGVFKVIYFVLTALFIAGLINPKWILRWDKNANRKKLAGYFFALALPVGVLGEFTKNDATRKYEERIRVEKEAEKKALAEQKAAENAQRQSANNSSRREQSSGGWDSNPAYPAYARAEDRFLTLVQAAKNTGALANPSCNSAVNNAYGQYQGEMSEKLTAAKSLPSGVLGEVLQADTQIFGSMSSTISMVCGVQ